MEIWDLLRLCFTQWCYLDLKMQTQQEKHMLYYLAKAGRKSV